MSARYTRPAPRHPVPANWRPTELVTCWLNPDGDRLVRVRAPREWTRHEQAGQLHQTPRGPAGLPQRLAGADRGLDRADSRARPRQWPNFRPSALRSIPIARSSSSSGSRPPIPDCIPDPAHLILGDICATLPTVLARLPKRAALVHNDLGTGDAQRNAELALWLARMLPPLLQPGGIVLSDQPLAHPSLHAEACRARFPRSILPLPS